MRASRAARNRRPAAYCSPHNAALSSLCWEGPLVLLPREELRVCALRHLGSHRHVGVASGYRVATSAATSRATCLRSAGRTLSQ